MERKIGENMENEKKRNGKGQLGREMVVKMKAKRVGEATVVYSTSSSVASLYTSTYRSSNLILK